MSVRPEVEVKIRSIADIRKLEASGIEAVYPQLSPHKIVEASAAQWPDKPAIRYLHDASDPIRDETVSYAELLARVEAAASLFRELGALGGSRLRSSQPTRFPRRSRLLLSRCMRIVSLSASDSRYRSWKSRLFHMGMQSRI